MLVIAPVFESIVTGNDVGLLDNMVYARPDTIAGEDVAVPRVNGYVWFKLVSEVAILASV